MLTVAGRRGRRVGGELSCDGLEDGEGGDEGVELGSGGLGGGEGGGEGGVLKYLCLYISQGILYVYYPLICIFSYVYIYLSYIWYTMVPTHCDGCMLIAGGSGQGGSERCVRP